MPEIGGYGGWTQATKASVGAPYRTVTLVVVQNFVIALAFVVGLDLALRRRVSAIAERQLHRALVSLVCIK